MCFQIPACVWSWKAICYMWGHIKADAIALVWCRQVVGFKITWGASLNLNNKWNFSFAKVNTEHRVAFFQLLDERRKKSADDCSPNDLICPPNKKNTKKLVNFGTLAILLCFFFSVINETATEQMAQTSNQMRKAVGYSCKYKWLFHYIQMQGKTSGVFKLEW